MPRPSPADEPSSRAQSLTGLPISRDSRTAISSVSAVSSAIASPTIRERVSADSAAQAAPALTASRTARRTAGSSATAIEATVSSGLAGFSRSIRSSPATGSPAIQEVTRLGVFVVS